MINPPAGELQMLGIHYKTDKAWRHFYMDIYESFLRDRRNDVKHVLELGVLGGASLRMWRDYFPNAIVTGLDNDPKCAQIEEKRIEIRLGDVSRLETFDQFPDDHFDVIVDDASHHPAHQITALCFLWPKLKRNGIYFIEDIGYTHRNWEQWFEVLQPQIFYTHKTLWSVLMVFDKKRIPRLGKEKP